MSVPVRPDLAAFQELEFLVRNLAEELATFRRRALAAEARVKELESVEVGAEIPADTRARIDALERENAELRDQLAATGSRAEKMLEKARFLRQQAEGMGAGNGGGDR